MEIPRSAARELTSTAGFGRHTTSAPFFGQTLAKGACIVGLIGEELPAERCAGEQRRHDWDVCDVAWAKAEGERTKGVVDEGKDLGGSPSAGATDRLYCALNARAGQTPNWFSRPAMRRRTVEIDILRWRAASEMLLASTILANIASEFGSVIFYPTYGNVILGFST
jgi:hypothetical protein